MSLNDKIKILQEYEEPANYIEYENAKGEKRKFPYFPYQSYKRRMDEVFGMDGYTTEYSDMKYLCISSGQESISCKCRLTLLDEDQQSITREGWGSAAIQYNSSGKEANLKNIPTIVQRHAFKAACQEFSIFGLGINPNHKTNSRSGIHKSSGQNPGGRGSAESGTGSSRQGRNVDGNGNISSPVEHEGWIHFSITGTMEIVRKDKNTGRDIYKISAYKIENNMQTDTRCSILFYPNRYAGMENQLKALISQSGKASLQLRLKVKQVDIRDGIIQYMFHSF